MQCARVKPNLSVCRQIVGPNVLSVQNVPKIKPVSINSARHRVWPMYAHQMPFVEWLITMQSVAAHLVLPAIHLLNALALKVRLSRSHSFFQTANLKVFTSTGYYKTLCIFCFSFCCPCKIRALFTQNTKIKQPLSNETILTHAFHHHAVQIHNVAPLAIRRHAHAPSVILADHQLVDQNVL